MRKDFGKHSWLYPMPVLIIATYNEDGTVNAMNAAWGSIYNRDRIGICVDKAHRTTQNILRTGSFTVSIANAAYKDACDYVGIVSGFEVPDKFEKAGFTASKSAFCDAPVINELPMCLECSLISYGEDEQLIGDILNVSADESILTDGKIDPLKLNPICYDSVHHTYNVLGEVVGHAFKDGLSKK